jgi:type V secretory pathway adhesin AidA
LSAHDVRPLVRLNVQIVAEQNADVNTGYHGMGGRYLYDRCSSRRAGTGRSTSRSPRRW